MWLRSFGVREPCQEKKKNKTDGQGNEVHCSGAQNALCQNFHFLCSIRCAMKLFVILLVFYWFFLERNTQGGRHEYLYGQKIYTLQKGLIVRDEYSSGDMRSQRILNLVFWNTPLISIGVQLVLDVPVNPIPYLLYYLLTECPICAFKCNLYNWNYRLISSFICVSWLPYILLKMN